MENERIVYTKTKRPPRQFEVISDEKLVETAGYIPPEKRINQFIQAGKRLQSARMEAYDFPDSAGNFDDIDPTRDPNFDLSDASNILNEMEENLNGQTVPESNETDSTTGGVDGNLSDDQLPVGNDNTSEITPPDGSGEL